jgi:hypothetical protein
MVPVQDYCKVTDRGLRHLFTRVGPRCVCACGRKLLAVDDDTGVLAPRDIEPEERLVPCARRTMLSPLALTIELLCAHGEEAIRRARRAQQAVERTRANLVRVLAAARLVRSAAAVAIARRTQHAAASARAQRDLRVRTSSSLPCRDPG